MSHPAMVGEPENDEDNPVAAGGAARFGLGGDVAPGAGGAAFGPRHERNSDRAGRPGAPGRPRPAVFRLEPVETCRLPDWTGVVDDISRNQPNRD